MLQRRGVGTTVHRSNLLLQSGTPCRLRWVLHYSDLASVTTGADPPRPKTSLGSILTRSSNRPAPPPKRPVQRPLDNVRPRSDASHSPPSARPSRNANDSKGIELHQIPSQQFVRPAEAVDSKDEPPHMQNADKKGSTNQLPQLASEREHAREFVKAPPESKGENLPQTNLAEFFAPRVYSAQTTRGRGGDYSGYLPPTVTRSLDSLGPVERALLALGRNKDVPYESRRRAMEIISRSIPSRARKA